MNLHGIVKGIVGSVNPEISVSLWKNTGYTIAADGKQIPAWSKDTKNCQVQGTSGKDLQILASQNIQGVVRVVFLDGNWHGVVKAARTGGDILKFPEIPGGTIRDWKAVLLRESWPDWSAIYVEMQSTVVV